MDHRRSGTSFSAPAYTVLRRLDDLAYRWGVWQGAVRRGTAAPLKPCLALRAVSRWTAARP